MRLMVKPRPSKVSRMPASAPISSERDSRRASRIVAITSSDPNTTAEMRQPKLFMPNAASPRAISHLPAGGCTMNAPTSVRSDRSPAATCWLAASPLHSAS